MECVEAVTLPCVDPATRQFCLTVQLQNKGGDVSVPAPCRGRRGVPRVPWFVRECTVSTYMRSCYLGVACMRPG